MFLSLEYEKELVTKKKYGSIGNKHRKLSEIISKRKFKSISEVYDYLNKYKKYNVFTLRDIDKALSLI